MTGPQDPETPSPEGRGSDGGAKATPSPAGPTTPASFGLRLRAALLRSQYGLPGYVWVVCLSLAAWYYAYAGTRLACTVRGTKIYSLTDEQLISMRYARNLAEGHGLVWNAGEAPVEGYSNFLWTLWMAVGHKIGLPETHVSLWIVGSSALAILTTAVFAAIIAHRLAPKNPLAPFLALVFGLLYFPLLRWSITGFEVGILAMFYAGIVLAIFDIAEGGARGQRGVRRYILWGGLALLTRLDALSFVGSFGLVALWAAPDKALRKRVFWWGGGGLVGLLVVYTAWRYSYYGQWVPNTVILKIGGVPLPKKLEQGWDRFSETLQTHLAILIFPALMAFVAPQRERDATRGRWGLVAGGTIVLGFAAQILYMHLIGGDTWEAVNYANRPITTGMLPVLGLVAVGIASFIELLGSHIDSLRVRRVVGGVVTLGAMWSLLWVLNGRVGKDWLEFNHCKSALWKKVDIGLYLKEMVPPETHVAVVWAGALPYFSHLPSVDLLGKSDPVIAREKPRNMQSGHNKWNYEYSIGELRPGVIASLFKATKEDKAYLRSLGYKRGYRGIWYDPKQVPPLPAKPKKPKKAKVELNEADAKKEAERKKQAEQRAAKGEGDESARGDVPASGPRPTPAPASIQ